MCYNNMNNNVLDERKGNSGLIVDIVTVNFFDWDGDKMYKGGAERYVYDLACLFRGMGHRVRIVQCSNRPFKKVYRGIDVIGTGFGNREDVESNSRKFADYCSSADLVIVSPLELACEMKGMLVIGINHGVGFDGDWNVYPAKYKSSYDVYMHALENVKCCVCVDTNFINWTRTISYELSLKECYIPNYYDEKIFFGRKRRWHKDKKVRFIYPRRICEARGYDLVIEATEQLLPYYSEKLQIDFIGQIDEPDVKERMDSIIQKYPDNVRLREYNMEEMGQAYEGADVSLIPTKFSEGTSLSCIESMASGVAVIATNVGGLPNLVIDRFNGLMVSPDAKEIADAMRVLIDDAKLRKTMGRNGSAVAKIAFSKRKWEDGWKKVIEKSISGF